MIIMHDFADMTRIVPSAPSLRRDILIALSSAGISITGLTDLRSLEVTDFEEHDKSH
jgi:hypothetical protein